MPEIIDFDRLSCPVPLSNHEHILLGHGSGGRLTADLDRAAVRAGVWQ